MMSWKPLPDLLSISLLIYAFLSVSRPGASSSVTRFWLVGWIMIEVHFLASMLAEITGVLGFVGSVVTTSALTWGALYFSRSMDAKPHGLESRSWIWGLCVVNTLFFVTENVPDCPQALHLAAVALYAVVPVALLLRSRVLGERVGPRLFDTSMYCAMSVLLTMATLGLFGALSDSIAVDAVLTVPYLICFLRFVATPKRKGGGFVVTAIGLLAWSLVFTVGELFLQLLPDVHIDMEVWNLPKFLVAAGMILLLLEDEVARNQHMAQHDSLTTLPNRRQFLERLNEAIERARGASARLALLSVDLDGFKQVNDRLGHHAGDAVLQRVAALFSSRVRRGDLLARVGGDEFFVVLEGNLVRERAQQVADNLRELLEEPLQLGKNSVKLGASVGIAIFPEDAQALEPLCVIADERMYAAKARRAATAAGDGAPALPKHGSLRPVGA
jgi:diguanylate cyclase (GGDEF)-like protein